MLIEMSIEKQNKLNTIALLGNALDMNGLEIRFNYETISILVINKRTNTEVKIPFHQDGFRTEVFNGDIASIILSDKQLIKYYELD